MKEKSLTILAVSDLHYTGLARQTAQPPDVRGELARILLRKVFLRLEHMGVKPDLTLMLGDLVESGADNNTRLDLITLHGELTRSGIPFKVIPGNHDVPSETLCEVFDSQPGLFKINGYGLVFFHDNFVAGRDCERASDDIAMIRKIAAKNPDMPLVAVQHAPVYPAIDSHYPYRPANAAEVIESFEKARVVLSLSGHYHHGQKARLHENVLYHTAPALSEAPFRFSLIRLKGRQVEIENLQLAMQVPNIVDVHSHTEHAYCRSDIDTAPGIALSKAMGLSALCITEHAFQLYFNRRDAMGFKWQSDASMAEAVWKTPERGRMAAYRGFAEKLRSPFVKIGLEVELFDNGRLLLSPQDTELEWDILIGAMHGIQGFERGRTTQKQAEQLFMRDLELLLDHNVQVLAHPFRFFTRHDLKVPERLFEKVASLLADNGVAAEINFHTYQPENDFIRCCLEKGVKLALASDAHNLAQAGEFWPHVSFLREVGVTPKMYLEKLFSL